VTAASFFRDITAFSVQIAVVGLGLAVLLKLVKIPAGVRFFGLRLALVASLVVPWLLRAPEVQAPALATAATPAASLVPLPASGAPTVPEQRAIAAGPSKPPAIPWTHVGFGALLIGIAARIVWLSMGVLRLFRLQRGSVVVDAPEYSALQQQLGTRATIAEVPALSQPATFGVRRPVVLLPEALAGAPASLRRAVVTHELFHVRRRDWLSALVEEMVRTALWFHPAILWMTSQIQLAREEIVDELTVRATGDRRTYVEALLAFADTPGLSPAPAFAQRRQLFQRILSVSKERVMSRPRMLSSAAVLLTAVVGASWYASTLFPIIKAAKVEQVATPSAAEGQASSQSGSRLVLDGDVQLRPGEMTVRASHAAVLLLDQGTGEVLALRPVTPENPIPRRTRGVAPVTPSQYASVQVVVSARITVDRNGVVTSVDPDSCSASGGRNDAALCAAFNDATAAAVRQWRYDRPAQPPIQFYVKVSFRPGAEAAISQSSESYLREPQDSLRALAETERDTATVQRAVASLQADLARLTDMSREVERAQRLGERGLLAQSTLQDGMARLRAELSRVEAQLQNIRLTGDDRARVERQYQAVLEQYRDAEQQFRAANAQQLAAEQARTVQQLRESERQLDQAARQFEANRDSQTDLETLARAARDAADAVRRAEAGDAQARAQAQAATERLREAQRKLEASRAQRSASAAGPQQLRSPSGRAPLQVGGPVTAPVAVKTVKPQHSQEAMRARAEGTVTLEALVDERGRVADARVVKSIPLLDQSALDAAKQWEFKPARLNGEPVPVLIQLELKFTLK
jgi:TonB family protein